MKSLLKSFYTILLVCLAMNSVSLAEKFSGAEVTAKNTLNISRESETIELSLADFISVNGISQDHIMIVDKADGTIIIPQVYDIDGKIVFVFQTDFEANQTKTFEVKAAPVKVKAPEPMVTTFAQMYLSRDGDMAWENDKMAARMYGKELEWETISNGIDLWCKEVTYPIVDLKLTERLKQGLSYHESRGVGCDAYKVGPTLGCGGATIFKNNKLQMPDHNFVDWRIVTNGPTRSIFELVYNQWDAAGIKVSETKRVTVDLGSYLCKVESTFESDTSSLPVAIGIITRGGKETLTVKEQSGWMAYSEPAIENNTIHCGVIVPANTEVSATKAQMHSLFTTTTKPGTSLAYYAGGSWDRYPGKEVQSHDSWCEYLKNETQKINNPIIVKSKYQKN